MGGVATTDMLWCGEIRLTVLVPKEWPEEQFSSIEETLEKLSISFRELAEKVLTPPCQVESRVL